MENELKKDFTRRLSQCNSGEMIVIIYDIFFAYGMIFGRHTASEIMMDRRMRSGMHRVFWMN